MFANGKQEVRIPANSGNYSTQNAQKLLQSNKSHYSLIYITGIKSKPAIWPEPSPIEKLNWLIHLQHIRGETESCKELIKSEITNTSRNSEYAFFKQVSFFILKSFPFYINLFNYRAQSCERRAKSRRLWNRFKSA